MPKYKLSEDGNEVYMLTDNGERKVDPVGLIKKVTDLETSKGALGKEAEKYRKGNAELGKQLEGFTSVLGENKIEDAVAALDSVTKLSDKHQLDLSKATISLTDQHKKKLEATELAYKAQVGELTDNLSGAVAKFTKELHYNRVLRSEVLDKTRYKDLRSDAYSRFGEFFNSDGTYSDKSGGIIPSTVNPGSPAGFDEAIEVLIDADDEAGKIWSKPEARGTGGQNANGGQFHTPIHERSASDNIADGMKKKFG